ncbi:hypothetical protein DESUT3_38010 [Desulfuromonas versatilis]|uniref:Response regulatory domain-containing protein n=1 Tax=Desulfuromonas versatilis TaxID=2802975 RepID=A0ABM8HWL9_9BACT|nr:response regulator [Desulfuromonas versatilis]BCR06732.1 hypothetical protein DESUT3_38010 [Desulfuromonas versatilis]
MATILLVDDVKLFLELEKSFLEGAGHRVVTAANGEEALAGLVEAEPDLLLLDLYMPGRDGDEICRELRASTRWRDLPVIMVTAAGKEEEIGRCLAAGCDDYITKPVNKNDLLEKVQRVLGGVRGRTATRVPATLRVQLKSRDKSLSATARDISRNGIYVKSSTSLAVGSPVELRLELPDGRQLPVLGKVKRVQEGPEGGMGIYFVAPEPQGVRALEELVNQGLESPEPAAQGVAEQVSDPRFLALEDENRRLRRRIAELETENREFAEQIVQIEEINNNLTNLYVASSRLHSVLDRGQVVEIIKEVVINFVGAEKFALLLQEKDSSRLRLEAAEGFEGAEFPEVSAGEGILGSVAAGGPTFLLEGSVVQGSDDPAAPLAAVPLKIHDQTTGVLAIYRLFVQKEKFAPVDHQLFSMMAEHAATALFSSGLYEASERKRETYKGFVDLLLKG